MLSFLNKCTLLRRERKLGEEEGRKGKGKKGIGEKEFEIVYRYIQLDAIVRLS